MEFKTVTPELLEQLQAAVPGRVHTVPPAFTATLPPMVANFSPGSGG